MQLNVDTGEYMSYELAEGQFPVEPWFVARPGADDEDDGVVMVQGTDGKKKKGTAPDVKQLSFPNSVLSFCLELTSLSLNLCKPYLISSMFIFCCKSL